MCGITGVFRARGVDALPVAAMTRALSHRGPDEEGIGTWPHPSGADVACVLGVRRLAICDVSGGQQPTQDETGRIHVVLNGEVYNHRQLRDELVANGVQFRTQSDTEVVANLVARMGVDAAMGRLQGMFALAMYDSRIGRLTLVRDRMGVKPLYWTKFSDTTLAWASELVALRTHPGARDWQPDQRALRAFLLFEYVPTPWTPWVGVHKLEPGTLLESDGEGVRHRTWWSPPLPTPGRDGNLARWARSLEGALQVAVAQRTDADVDVGFLLSGGLDSSAVVALAQARSRSPIPTFSVAVDAPGFDESPHARRVAATLGTYHREARLRAVDLDRILDEIGKHVSEPLADSSLVATWRLMELVRDAGLKCVLSGDGADESFAGYPTYLAHRLARVAAPLRGPMGAITRRLPTSMEGVSRDYMAKRFVSGLGHPWARRHQVWMGAWTPSELNAGPEVWQVVDQHAAKADGTDPISRAMYLDQRLYLADGVLVKVDRASMAHGIEVRSPFLAHSLVELAADMPVGMKVHGRKRKVVLKAAMAAHLPQSVLSRRKQGFGTPIGPWLRGPAQHLLSELPEAVADLVPPERLATCIREHRSGRADHRRRLWSAIVLARWRQHHGASS
jgi:asparagine synthase (glutamine-hydrolysing)